MVTKLTLEYDGTDFIGWARQPGLRTVQEELERALHTVLGETSATGEPLTLDGRRAHRSRGARLGTGRELCARGGRSAASERPAARGRWRCSPPSRPPMVGTRAARRSARTYCYRMLTRRARSAFERRYALWWPRPLDRGALDECAGALLGVHDFTAFTPTETAHVRFERRILAAEWREGTEGEMLEFWIEADTFMRHMVRILVGTMLEVASHQRTPAEFADCSAGARASQAGPTAPAHGLALASVTYPSAE